jgi:hypothetical protein
VVIVALVALAYNESRAIAVDDALI